MEMSVKQFIKKHCVLHDDNVTYNDEKKSFNVNNYADRFSRGVYFITVGDHIMKVGKADGLTGFYSRFSKYRCNLEDPFNRREPSVVMMYNAMTRIRREYGNDVKMEVWVHKMDNSVQNYHGFEVPSTFIRGFEYELSLRAHMEGHPMYLSGQN